MRAGAYADLHAADDLHERVGEDLPVQATVRRVVEGVGHEARVEPLGIDGVEGDLDAGADAGIELAALPADAVVAADEEAALIELAADREHGGVVRIGLDVVHRAAAEAQMRPRGAAIGAAIDAHPGGADVDPSPGVLGDDGSRGPGRSARGLPVEVGLGRRKAADQDGCQERRPAAENERADHAGYLRQTPRSSRDRAGCTILRFPVQLQRWSRIRCCPHSTPGLLEWTNVSRSVSHTRPAEGDVPSLPAGVSCPCCKSA